MNEFTDADMLEVMNGIQRMVRLTRGVYENAIGEGFTEIQAFYPRSLLDGNDARCNPRER